MSSVEKDPNIIIRKVLFGITLISIFFIVTALMLRFEK